jgi:hypothetical protein
MDAHWQGNDVTKKPWIPARPGFLIKKREISQVNLQGKLTKAEWKIINQE